MPTASKSLLETAEKAHDNFQDQEVTDKTADTLEVVETTTDTGATGAETGDKAPPPAKPVKGSGSSDTPERPVGKPRVSRPQLEAGVEKGAEPGAEETAEGEQPATKVTRPSTPPVSWSGTAKAAWPKLPPLIQQEVLKRERDIAQHVQGLANQAKLYNGLDVVLKPVEQQLAVSGLPPAEYIRRLVAADMALQQKPTEALAWIARNYGIDVSKAFPNLVAQGAPNAAAGTAAVGVVPKPGDEGYVDPQITAFQKSILDAVGEQIKPLRDGLVEMQGSFRNRDQQAQLTHHQQLVSAVEAFQGETNEKGELSHPYFDEVRQHMAAIMQQGLCRDMEDAYQQAVRANPTVYEAVQKAAGEAAQARALAVEEERRKVAARKAADARRSGQLGPATHGAAPGSAPVKGRSIEDTVRGIADRILPQT